MNPILFVVYHYPPDTAVGAVRPAQFAKYLPEFGWRPMILTVYERYYELGDPSGSAPTTGPEVVVRTRMLRSPLYYYRRLRRRPDHAPAPGATSPGRPAGSPGLAARLRRFVGSLLTFPDEVVGWFPFALLRALLIIRRHRVRVVVTSAPPHSVHLIGAWLSKLAGVHWVADFRDPYLDTATQSVGETFFTRLARRFGAWFVAQASVVVSTTERFSECLRLKYPGHRHKVVTIPNGYDPEEFDAIPRGKDRRFTIAHVGSLFAYERRTPEPVLRAVAELLRDGHMDRSRLMLRFVGVRGDGQQKLNALVAKYDLAPNVEIRPWLPRRQALETMARSHVLLALAPQQPLQIPAKIFDYFAAGSDVLAITEDGATADLLAETGAGIPVTAEQPDAVKHAIHTFYGRYLRDGQGGEPHAGPAAGCAGYHRRQLTERLASVLDGLVSARRGTLAASPRSAAATK